MMSAEWLTVRVKDILSTSAPRLLLSHVYSIVPLILLGIFKDDKVTVSMHTIGLASAKKGNTIWNNARRGMFICYVIMYVYGVFA